MPDTLSPLYWFRRPPVARWVAAAVLIGLALYVEFRPEELVMHPYAAHDAAAGEVVAVELRAVPRGLIPLVAPAPYATRTLEAGAPLLPGDTTPGVAAPAGWWSLALELPAPAAPGARVRMVVIDTAGVETSVDGVVVTSTPGNGFSPPGGLIAVPGDQASALAAAAAQRRVTVLIQP